MGPLIEAGVAGILEPTLLHLVPLDAQGLVAATQIVPVEYAAGKFTVMEFVFVPDAMVAPEGTVQLYPDASVTAGTE